MILSDAYVLTAPGMAKKVSDLKVGDMILGIEIPIQNGYPVKPVEVSSIETKTAKAYKANDMIVSVDAELVLENTESQSPVLDMKVFSLHGSDSDYVFDPIYSLEEFDEKEFLKISTKHNTYFAGPTEKGPFFLFYSRSNIVAAPKKKKK